MKKRAKICFYIFLVCAFCALGILGYFVFNDGQEKVMLGSRKFVTFNQVPGAVTYSISVNTDDDVNTNNYVAKYRVEKTETETENEFAFKIEVLSKENVKIAEETYTQTITSENSKSNTINCVIKDYTINFYDGEGQVIDTKTFEKQSLKEQNRNIFCCVISEYFESIFVKDGKYDIIFCAYDDNGQEIEDSQKEIEYDYYAYYQEDFERRADYYINGAWYNYVISSEEELTKLVWHTILYRQNNVSFYVKTENITPKNINSLVVKAINNYPEYDGLKLASYFATMEENVGRLENFNYYLEEQFTKTYKELETGEEKSNAYNKALKELHKKDENYCFDNYIIGEIDLDGRSFDIDSAVDEVLVNNSEQLFMVVQYGAKPIFSEDATVAETIYENAKTVLKQINNSDSLTDYEKALNIYRYICSNIVYDYVTYEYMAIKNDFSIQSFGNYACFYLEGALYDLENQYAVCDGLAKAYTLLCNIEGIDCVKVNGEVIGEGNHAWNKVNLVDEKYSVDGWYLVDPTWGVATYAGYNEEEDKEEYFEIITHTYFLNSDLGNREVFFEGEVADKAKEYEYYKSVEYSYALKNGDYYIESDEELADIFGYAQHKLSLGKNSFVLEIKVDDDYRLLNSENLIDKFIELTVTRQELEEEIEKANKKGNEALAEVWQDQLDVVNASIQSWFEGNGIFATTGYEWFMGILSNDVLIFRFYSLG